MNALGTGWFQSLTRDSNHSNGDAPSSPPPSPVRFNPSRGIAIIQTHPNHRHRPAHRSFNPSRGIAIIQARAARDRKDVAGRFNPSRGIAIIQTSDMTCSTAGAPSFNPSRGIAIIQTHNMRRIALRSHRFQSLTRDSNHSNYQITFDPTPILRVSIPHAG